MLLQPKVVVPTAGFDPDQSFGSYQLTVTSAGEGGVDPARSDSVPIPSSQGGVDPES